MAFSSARHSITSLFDFHFTEHYSPSIYLAQALSSFIYLNTYYFFFLFYIQSIPIVESKIGHTCLSVSIRGFLSVSTRSVHVQWTGRGVKEEFKFLSGEKVTPAQSRKYRRVRFWGHWERFHLPSLLPPPSITASSFSQQL
jgi:hypothetical protein